MITTLAGPNSYLLQAELKRRVQAFVTEYTDMGLERLDGEEMEYDRLREALESVPFLVPKKLVVLLTPSANKQFVERAEKLLAAVGETTDVIIVEPKLDKRSGYYKLLQKQTDYQLFEELDENGLAAWLSRTAKSEGGVLSLADARYLIGLVGANQRLLANELAKLLTHAPQVTRQTIDLLVEPTPQSSIFDLLDAAFAGRLQRAMQLYAEQRQAKVEPQQILAMIAWQLHVLALVRAAGARDPQSVAKEAKLNPYVVRKSAGVANKLGGAQLKRLIHEALLLDARLKRESLDADDALSHFLMRLAA